ncbi:MAG: hypothetical protein ACKN9I_05905 [Alphaproteobacteria bacterium]
MIPTLPKLPNEIKKLIADKISRSVPDEEIIKEYSKSYEISPEILRRIRDSIERSSTSTPAPIVLLFGTSSAGKTRIINNVMILDESLPETERARWEVNGSDLEAPRQWKALDPARDHENFKSLLKNGFEREEIDNAILSGALPSGASDKYAAEDISKLQGLIGEYHELYKNTVANMSNEKVLEAVFARALEQSREGIPSILDVVPLKNGYDVVKAFNEYMEKNGSQSPTTVAVAYCGINELVDHMEKRNKTGDPEEIRNNFVPIQQFGIVYRHAKEGDNVIGEITIQDVINAANKYGENRGSGTSLESHPDAQAVLKNLGIPEGFPEDHPIKITTKFPCNVVYQTDLRKSGEDKESQSNTGIVTDGIAIDIQRLGRNARYAPSPAPSSPRGRAVEAQAPRVGLDGGSSIKSPSGRQ